MRNIADQNSSVYWGIIQFCAIVLIVKIPEGSMETDSGSLVSHESENTINWLRTAKISELLPWSCLLLAVFFTVKFSCSWFQETFTQPSRL